MYKLKSIVFAIGVMLFIGQPTKKGYPDSRGIGDIHSALSACMVRAVVQAAGVK